MQCMEYSTLWLSKFFLATSLDMSLRSTVTHTFLDAHEKPAYHETLTYFLATLQDIRTSSCALIRRRTDYSYECVGRLQRRLFFYCSIRTYLPVALCLYLVIKFICQGIRIWIIAHNPCGFTYRQSVWKLKLFRWSQRSESFYTYSIIIYSKLLKLHWSYPLLT